MRWYLLTGIGLTLWGCGTKESVAPLRVDGRTTTFQQADGGMDAESFVPESPMPPVGFSCEEKKCSGRPPPELEEEVMARAQFAHSCYDRALARNASAGGTLRIRLRLGTNGLPCSVAVTENTTQDEELGGCIADTMRTAHYPAPTHGCIDLVVPMVLRQRSSDAGR
jgi:hypothetical protein